MKNSDVSEYLNSLEIYHDIRSLDDITCLIQRHLSHFNFTSIKVLLKEQLSLELESLIQNIVVQKRGGYCFEHNKIIYEVLKHFGFDVVPLFARVLNNRDINVAQTHRFTLLKLNSESYIVDVGFGFYSPTKPIKLSSEPTKTLQDLSYVVNEYKNSLALQLIMDKQFYTLYSFDMQKYHDADFEMGHFYSHKHPKANFVNNLVLSKIEEDKIYSLVNDKYRVMKHDRSEVIMIKSVEVLQNLLNEVFMYDLEEKDVEYLFNNFCKK